MSVWKLKSWKFGLSDNAWVTEEQLREVESLEGATMPDGRKYEDWLKDKEGSLKTDGN
jgi:hypothetical protein